MTALRSHDALSRPDAAGEHEVLAVLLGSIERWAASHVDSLAIDREGTIPKPLLEQLGEMGWFGLSIPEAYGGAELSLRAVCRAVTALARHDRSIATTVGLHLGLGTRGLVAFGAGALRDRYLPGLATGQAIAAFATTESEAGSDLSAIRTRAVESPRGRLRVEGEKVWVTNAALARIITITAATPGLGGARRGHSLIVLERDDPGVKFQREEHKLGIRGSSTAGLRLDGVEVPIERVLGEPGAGMAALAHVLSWGRTLMAAGCVGAAQAALDRAADWVATRRQFGRTLISFELVREQLADVAALVFAMEALVARTAEVEAHRELLATRSTAAKVFCSEGDWEAADVALQLHGGSGFIETTGVAILLRDARITRIFEGANDVLLIHLGSLEATRAAATPGPAAATGILAADLAAFCQLVSDWRADHTRRLGVRLLRQQRLLHRLGRLVVLREAAEAAVARAGAEGTPAAETKARHFLALARGRALAACAAVAPLEDIDAIAGSLTPGRRPLP